MLIKTYQLFMSFYRKVRCRQPPTLLPGPGGPVPTRLTSPSPTSKGHTISVSTLLMTALYMSKVAV